MKKLFKIFCVILVSLSGLFYGCKKSNDSSTTTNSGTTCTVTGTTLNIGGSNGGNYSYYFGTNSDQLLFDNTALNFSINGGGIKSSACIVDVGRDSCLNFSDTSFVTNVVAAVIGDGYESVYSNGDTLKFYVVG